MATTAIAPVNAPDSYNGLGQLYNLYWRSFCGKLTPALEQLVLASLPRGSRVLDLCCGTGHLACVMCQRGLRVVGLDGSEDMVRFAKCNAPLAAFVVADARRFQFAERFAAVVSTGDSVNHMLTVNDLRALLANVFSALIPSGIFVFDMNTAEAFEAEWHKSSTVVTPDHLMYVRGRYIRRDRLGLTDVTVFNKSKNWSRQDFRIFQRCYRVKDVRDLLLEVGFVQVTAYTARSFRIRGRLAVGRRFFAARKPGANITNPRTSGPLRYAGAP